MGRNFPLESSWDNSEEEKEKGGKEKERKEKRKEGKEREESCVRGEEEKRSESSTFSLGFTEIGPLVFVGARGKVHLRGESFA